MNTFYCNIISSNGSIVFYYGGAFIVNKTGEHKVGPIQGGGSLAFIATLQPGSQLSDRSVPPRGKWLEQLSLAAKPDHRYANNTTTWALSIVSCTRAERRPSTCRDAIFLRDQVQYAVASLYLPSSWTEY